MTTPTLSTFTLAGRTVIVTGGAQGLGAVMARGIVLSGGEVAIVDLQSMLTYISEFSYFFQY